MIAFPVEHVCFSLSCSHPNFETIPQSWVLVEQQKHLCQAFHHRGNSAQDAFLPSSWMQRTLQVISTRVNCYPECVISWPSSKKQLLAFHVLASRKPNKIVEYLLFVEGSKFSWKGVMLVPGPWKVSKVGSYLKIWQVAGPEDRSAWWLGIWILISLQGFLQD